MRYPYEYDKQAYPYGSEMIMPEVKLAQAWVPYQRYRCFYPLPVGWDKGTIFIELYRPYYRKSR